MKDHLAANQFNAPSVQPERSLAVGLAPVAWQQHWASMPNNVTALLCTFQKRSNPNVVKEVQMEAWGQLCFDDIANETAARYMKREGMARTWRFVSWRCEMSSPPVGGGKVSAPALPDFESKYLGLADTAEAAQEQPKESTAVKEKTLTRRVLDRIFGTPAP